MLLSFLYFGLPVASHPGRTEVGSIADPNIFIWSFAWWPHAILHGLNPVYIHVLWAPSGLNLAWITSIPGLAIAFAPLTLLAGPVVAYNTAAILIPGFSAWTAFLLCRYLTRSFWPSLAGGYLFGFSSYMLSHEEGHMNLAAVLLVPLVALVVLRFLDGELGGRGAAWRLGVLLAAQLSISTEIFATVTLALAVALAIAFGFITSARRRIRSLVVPVVSGYAIAAVLASPLLYYAITDFPTNPLGPTSLFVTDAVNLVVPTQTAALGGGTASSFSASFSGSNELEQNAYLGLPILVIVALFAWRRRMRPVARFLLVAFTVAVLASFGSALHVHGHRIVALPWWLVHRLPVFDNIYPGRLMLYAALAAAVMAALWAASHDMPRSLRVVLPVLAVVSLLPHLGRHRWDETPRVPALFRDGGYKACLAPGENVLAIPYGYLGHSVLWQALSHFDFRLAGGQIGDQVPNSFVNSYSDDHVVAGLLSDSIPAAEGGSVFAFAEEKGVSTIVVDPSDPWPWSSVLAGHGQPKEVGGVLLYSVRESRSPETRQCR